MGKGLIIGVSGRARSGKDTFAEMLAEEIFKASGNRFVLMAYAQELKLRVQRDFDLTYDQLWGDKKEIEDTRYPRNSTWVAGRREQDELPGRYWTPREIMQAYGEFYRSIDKQFWVKNLFRAMEAKGYENVIITDVRHPNEADPISEKGGFNIKVTSDRENKQEIHGSNHISETAMDDYNKIDFHIQNDKGLLDLQLAAKTTVGILAKAVQLKEKLEGKNGK